MVVITKKDPIIVSTKSRQAATFDDGMKSHEAKLGVGNSNDEARRQQAVCVRNAYKYYGSKNDPDHVLRNLNMTVTKGTIYGLIGASGCGKTTLLSCIVGRLQLNSGQICVLGRNSGSRTCGLQGKRVGYMPQQLALYGWFSIKEILMYFGWIFGLNKNEILEKVQFFTKLLDLKDENQIVETLSAGEQRRVSFAIALIHDPELLILDEPTVGVDSLLRQSIWEHFIELTKDCTKTVIITTHYIEEARQAHTIGLMWNGRLMVEESPQKLLSKYQCLTLEDIFLKFSRKQGDNIDANIAELNDSDNIEPLPGRNIDSMDCDEGLNCFIITTKGHVKALMHKNLTQIGRNLFLLLFNFALPITQVITLCLAIGRDPNDLRMAIVNHDMNQSRTYCLPKNGCELFDLGCRYLQHLNNISIIQDYYPDPETALQAVKRGDAWGVIHITESFTDSIVSLIYLEKNGGGDIVDQRNIIVTLDMSNKQIGIFLSQSILNSFRDFAVELLSDCDENPKRLNVLIKFQEPVYGTLVPRIIMFIGPPMLLQIVYFLAATLTSSCFIHELLNGLLDRNWVAGVTSFEILFSHVFTQFLVMCGQTALVLIFMMSVFGLECRGDLALVVSLALLHGLCGMCFGFFIAAVCKYEENVIQIATFTFFCSFLVCGEIWPVDGMPLVLRYLSQLLPQTLAVTSMRNLFNRGWDLSQPEVYYGFISTIIWIIVFIQLTIMVLKLKHG